jgi:cephalosporin hydroxylase
MSTDNLCNIFDRYASHNNYTGTDKNTLHSYGDLYEDLFTPIRHSSRSILEIGVFSGASLCVWADYFANATVVGLDITLANVCYGKKTPRINMFCMDGTKDNSVALLQDKLGTSSLGFDMILDDGSHQPQHQIDALRIWAPYLNRGGIFVIEDINESCADHVKTELQLIANKYNLIMNWHDLRAKTGRFDDIVASFTHKNL